MIEIIKAIQKDKAKEYEYSAPDLWITVLPQQDVVMASPPTGSGIGDPGFDNGDDTMDW